MSENASLRLSNAWKNNASSNGNQGISDSSVTYADCLPWETLNNVGLNSQLLGDEKHFENNVAQDGKVQDESIVTSELQSSDRSLSSMESDSSYHECSFPSPLTTLNSSAAGTLFEEESAWRKSFKTSVSITSKSFTQGYHVKPRSSDVGWKGRKRLLEFLPEKQRDRVKSVPGRYQNCLLKKYSQNRNNSAVGAQSDDWKGRFLSRCEIYDVKYIDSHCHLDFLFTRQNFIGSFRLYMRQNLDTFPGNFFGCIAVFCDPQSFVPSGLWKKVSQEENVWVTMGCHPKRAKDFNNKREKGLRKCMNHEKVVALGEIGLDYSGSFHQHAETQKKVFIKQIKIALEMEKPLIIHCRDAQVDCIEIMKNELPKNYRIHWHCFTQLYKDMKECISYFPNLFIGLTPLVTYKSAKLVHDAARNVPLNRLLLETDAPYFVPHMVPRGAMKFSHPGFAITVAEEVAKLKGITVSEVLNACRENTHKMYGI